MLLSGAAQALPHERRPRPATRRDLSEFEIAYLFLDGLAERLHPGQRKEAVLCAWGLDCEGKKHLLHLTPGTKEDSESVRGLIQDLKRRGLGDPLLKLIFAATLRASERWRGLKVTNFERAQLAAIREELDGEFKKRHNPAVRSTPSRISSKTET